MANLTQTSSAGGRIFCSKGSYYEVAESGNSMTQGYELEPAIEVGCPLLIMGAPSQKSDISARAPCMNGNRVFYNFGKNFGDTQIAGMLLMGDMKNSRSCFKAVSDYFEKNRSSVSGKPIILSGLVGVRYAFFLTHLRMESVDPEMHTMMFALGGTLLDVDGK